MLLFVALGFAGCMTKPRLQYKISSDYTVKDPQFLQTMGNLLGAPLRGSNTVKTYQNGDEIFPAMLEAIRSAKKTITFETYVYEKGQVGKSFADAFAERARAGVKVHIMVDSLGAATMEAAWKEDLKAAGAQLYEYHPLRFLDLNSYPKLDHRTHRKILVIDGVIGFTGGVGIADEWNGHAQDPAHWRDNQYRVEGPVVGQLQGAFADNWMETTGEVLQGDDYFPALPAPLKDGMIAQVFKNSFESGSQNMQLLLLLSVAGAGRSIRLESPYFVLDGLTESYLIAARKRGVSVEVIVPGKHIDVPLVRNASRANWGNLLKAGVAIYEYQPTMLHSKLMVVDDLWVSIGSGNLDDRSFRLNAEANLNVYDAAFAAQQVRMFEEDKSHAKRVTLEQWEKRPWTEYLQNAFATPMRAEL